MADELAFDSRSGDVVSLTAADTRVFNFWRTRQAALSDALTEAAGGEARLRVDVRPPPEPVGAASREAVPDSVAHAEAQKDPLVRRAMELFGARLIEVRNESSSDAAGPAERRPGANDDEPESGE